MLQYLFHIWGAHICVVLRSEKYNRKTSAPTPESVVQVIEQAIKTKKTLASESEIAFLVEVLRRLMRTT